jgi:hypothetical protein
LPNPSIFLTTIVEKTLARRQAPSSQPQESKLTFTQTCLSNCAFPYLAAEAEEQANTPETRSWLDTKEGQAHIKICIPSCEYKILQAKRDADAKLEEELKAEKLRKQLEKCIA